MNVRSLGRSGVSVSAVGLGGFELGPEDGRTPDVDTAVTVIQTALDAGINWIDTSENYNDTQNESLIGAALGRVSEHVMVATKAAPKPLVTGGGSGFRRDQIHDACRASLRRLGRDVIDVYFLHWPDDTGVPLDETWGAMGELVDGGLVRAIGLSNYKLADVEHCHKQRSVNVVQDGLSLIDYLDARDGFARCRDLGIGVVAYEPVASGILAGKTQDEVLAFWTGPWVDSAFYKRLLAPGRVERSFAVADGLRPIAARLKATVAQVAIAWVLHQRGVSAAIAGSRDGRHVHENALAAELNLSAVMDDLEQLIPLGPTFDAS
ncbi:MAG: aldo/keto reductase [Ilumatobacteraceae bacterium]|nr:aldo/keto reductase [Ilumatobacteraceae bacterium]